MVTSAPVEGLAQKLCCTDYKSARKVQSSLLLQMTDLVTDVITIRNLSFESESSQLGFTSLPIETIFKSRCTFFMVKKCLNNIIKYSCSIIKKVIF